MKAAIYARVSTKDKRQDTENQLRQLREFAKAQGWEVVELVDHETGGHAQRPQFQAMFQLATRRQIDLVLFWSLDRFSREGALPTLKHLEALSEYGVGFRSYTEQFLDSTGVFRDAIISILATLAKQEKIRISERTKAGLARAKAQGRRGGRPARVFSREHAAKLRAQGMSWRALGRELNIPQSTLRKALAN
jgi:DNA invertase Pin-like site-specific DNA recombinase